MLGQSIKTFIISTVFVSTTAFAQQDALVKGLNKKLLNLLKDSLEAQVFLDEDLITSSKLLDSSKITFIDSYNEYPFLMTSENGGMITLSQNLAFKGSKEDKTKLLTKMLFNIKRQLEGSYLPLPDFRIELFAKKFSSILFRDVSTCFISINELSKINTSIKKDLIEKVTNKLAEKGFSYNSQQADWIFTVQGKEKSDAECRGNNRNTYRLSAQLINLNTGRILDLKAEAGTACGYSQAHYKRSISQLIKKIQTNLPDCQSALDF